MLSRSLSLASATLTLIALGCSDDGAVVTGGRGCEKLGDTAVGEPGACAKTCTPLNDEFCGAMAVTAACPAAPAPTPPVDVCGVLLPTPPTTNDIPVELARSSGVDEFSGTGAPDLGCYDPSGYPAPPDLAASQAVTLKGVAKIFSHGCESNDLEIAVYKVVRDGTDNDGMPGELIGTKVVTAADCKASGGVPEEIEDCGTRYECTYEYPGVPSETELLVVTGGAIWAPIYEYGIFIRNAEVTAKSFVKDVRALAQDDYQVIAQVAMGKNITPGNGALAGEVHDCGDVRLVNAVVDVNTPKFVSTYFTNDEENPLPDLSAKGTSTLGLYAALDIAPGPIAVAAAGVFDGKLVSTGYFRARIFPDAVSSFTFRGLRPFQVP
ncbi:MAG: hypothetical protein EXR75_13835 [Myxococcales bacterium]|nr:hypothetical protein [Myxococcales bacterium]